MRSCADSSESLPVLCCDDANNPTFQNDPLECKAAATLQEAISACMELGLHLCRADELATGSQCRTGCEFDFDLVWTSSPCQQADAEEEYNCLDQPANWDRVWPVNKKMACCQRQGVGCYDCSAGNQNMWSADRAQLCCQLLGIGCSNPMGASIQEIPQIIVGANRGPLYVAPLLLEAGLVAAVSLGLVRFYSRRNNLETDEPDGSDFPLFSPHAETSTSH